MDCAGLHNGCRQCRSELEKRLERLLDVYLYIVKLEKDKERLGKEVGELKGTLKKKEDEEKEIVRRISMGAVALKTI